MYVDFFISKNQFSALQCWLECEPGYVAQRVPLITCVDGHYAKECHYLSNFTHEVPPTFVAKFIAQSIYRKSSSTLPKMPNSNEGLKIKGQGSRRKDPIIPFFRCYWGGHETFNVFETIIICFTNNDTSFMNPSSPRHLSANQQQR